MAFTVSRNGSSVLLVAQLRALVGVILGSSFLGPASSPLVNSKYNRTLRLTTSTLPPGPNHYYFSPRFSGDLLQALLRESSPSASQPIFNPKAGVILLERKSDLSSAQNSKGCPAPSEEEPEAYGGVRQFCGVWPLLL